MIPLEDVLTEVLGTLPIVAALIAVRAVNTVRATRWQQFALPFAALIYGILAITLFHGVQQGFDDVTGSMLDRVPALAQGIQAASLNTILNTLLIVVFGAVKFALRPLAARWVHGPAFPGSAVLSEFYEFDTEFDLWVVKRRLGNLRFLLRVVYVGSLAVVIVLLVLVRMDPAWNSFQAIAYPAIPALVLGECFFAVDGLTKPELRREITGEADGARRVARYGGLRRVLADTFGDRLLAVQLTASSNNAGKTHDRLDELRHSHDDVDRIAGNYFQRIKSAGEPLDANLLDAAVGLMHSTSAVINNPFYPDLTRYLIFPAYYHLLQYRKVLIVAGRDAVANDLVAWMHDGLDAITGVPRLWEVGVLDRHGREGLDVGVLRFSDLHNLEVIRSNDDFLADVEYVILAEPTQLLATGQLGLGLVLGRCGRDRAPVFVAFDRNHDGLVDALSHLLKTNLTEVVASALPTGTSLGAVWRSDSASMTAAIIPKVTRYLGMGTEIAAVALKHQVSTVSWVGAERFPVTDMGWIAGQYHQQISSFAELDGSQQALAESIVPWPNPWNLPQQENRFLVVEDEFANAYESIRLYASRARNQGFVNLISDDYLLRDYMVDNAEIFSVDPKAIPSIVPDFARTERNSVLRLALTMTAFEVPAATVAKELEIIGVSVPGVGSAGADTSGDAEQQLHGERQADQGGDPPELEVLKRLIIKHIGVEPLIRSVNVPADGDGEAAIERRYRIGSATGPGGEDLGDISEALRPAYFFVEDEREEENYIGALLFCHVYQALLPGQFVTYAGKYYEVQGIGAASHRNGVVLRRAAEHITDRRVYRQLRRFTIEQIVTDDAIGARRSVGNVEVIRAFATVSVETDGFVELPSRSDLAAGKVVSVSGVPMRRYSGKAILKLRFPGIPADVRQTISVLINELFVTVFPQAHPYVVALTVHDHGELSPLLSGLVTDDDSAAETIFIVEDSIVDLGLTVAVERHWERLFEIVTDYLEWRSGEDGSRGNLSPLNDVPAAATPPIAEMPATPPIPGPLVAEDERIETTEAVNVTQ